MTDPLPNTNRNVSTISRNLALEPRFNGTGIVSAARAGTGSGCLISDRWVLTARHVVAGATNGTFFLEGTNRPIVEVHTRPDSDVALVKLATALTNYPATPIYQGSSEVGRAVWVVGYGRHGQFTGNPAELSGPFQGRYAAMNRVALVTNVGSAVGTCLQFAYDTGADALPLEGATAPGDSGGPMFMEENGRLWVVGEIFGVLFSAPGFYVGRVSSYKEWIRATTGINFNEALWDADPVTPGIQNGAGSWGGANSNWYFGRTNFPWAGGYDVVFGGGTNPVGTINVSADTFVGDITFLANNVSQTLAGKGTLTLKNSAIVSNATSVTISAPLAGGGLTKTGAGTLTLSAANTYTGGTTIQGGTLYLGGAGRLGTGNVTIASGANLDFGTGASQANIVANDISGDGSILQNVAGTDTRFTGNLTSTGGMTINAGTVRIGNGGTTGSYNGNATVNTGAVLAFARNGAYTHGGTITGAGGVTKTSSGEVTLTGNNSYSGPTTLFTGVLVADNANALGTGDIIFRPEGGNNGTIRYTAASAGTDWASRIKGSTGTIRLDTDGHDVNLAGAIDSSNINGLTKTGAGTLTLSAANTYKSSTTINAGTLRISPTGSLLFVMGGSGVNNGLVGAGNVLVDGQFVFNLAGASTDTNATWTIVNPSLNATYGTNFMVTGFNGSGGTWTLVTNGVTYRFQQSTGVLSVQSSGGGGYGGWVSYWQGVDPGFTNTAPGADPDGDSFSNGLEFAFDGNPTMGTPALLRLTRAGTNAVASWVERNTGVSYTVQATTNLVIGPWTNAAVTVTNAADQSGISLTNDYTRKSFTVPAAGQRFFRVQATLAD